MSAPTAVALVLAAGLLAFALAAEIGMRATVRALGWIEGRKS